MKSTYIYTYIHMCIHGNLHIKIYACKISTRTGDRFPIINLSKVDLPAPFGPTRATRESESSPMHSSLYK